VYVVQAAINPNDASEQVANEEATTDGGAQISERVSPRLGVDVKCSPAVDMLEQCAEPAGLNETRRNVPTDGTNDESNRQEAIARASCEMSGTRPEVSTEAPVQVEQRVCDEHTDDNVQATDRPYDVNKKAIIAAEAPGERQGPSNGKVMRDLDSAGDTVPTIDTEQIMIREHDSAIISTWCGIGSSPTAHCTGTVPTSLCVPSVCVSSTTPTVVPTNGTPHPHATMMDANTQVAMAAPTATNDKVDSVQHRRAPWRSAPCNRMAVNELRTGANAKRQRHAVHTVGNVRDADHLNDENKEATIEARAPDVCGNQPKRVKLMGYDQASAQTMKLGDETMRSNITVMIDRMWGSSGRSPTNECTAIIPISLCDSVETSVRDDLSPVSDFSDQQAASIGRNDLQGIGSKHGDCPLPMPVDTGMALSDGGVRTLHACRCPDDDSNPRDIERTRVDGHRGEQSTEVQRGDMPPGVANNNQVIKDGGVCTMSNIGRRDDNKRRLADSDREQHRAAVRRVAYDQIVRPPDVVTDERAHVEEYDMSGNRVHQYATAVVNAKVDMPSGKCQHQGLNEMRKRILATLATNMTDVGPTCEASSVSDCIATMTPVTSVTQSNATMPTSSAMPSTAGIAGSSYGTVGVDVM
jgi:hypothetical protein